MAHNARGVALNSLQTSYVLHCRSYIDLWLQHYQLFRTSIDPLYMRMYLLRLILYKFYQYFNAKGTDLRILVLTFEAINSREELITFCHYACSVIINLTLQIA